jgi:hypothetical protein
LARVAATAVTDIQIHFSISQSHFGSVFHKVTHKAVEISEKHLKNRILATLLKRDVNNCAIAATEGHANRRFVILPSLLIHKNFKPEEAENFFRASSFGK